MAVKSIACNGMVMAVSPVRICILCFGNSARGDDALGEALFHWLQQQAQQQLTLFANVKSILGFQLQPEQIFDLRDADIGIFVDARANASKAVSWTEVSAGSQLHFSSHHVPPDSLLFLYEETFRTQAPRCFQLEIGAQCFELGAPLSAAASRNLQQAQALLLGKLKSLGGL